MDVWSAHFRCVHSLIDPGEGIDLVPSAMGYRVWRWSCHPSTRGWGGMGSVIRSLPGLAHITSGFTGYLVKKRLA